MNSDERSVLDTAKYRLSSYSCAHARLSEYWLQECGQKHPHCQPRRAPSTPTRLVEIVDTVNIDHTLIKLSQHHPINTRYCTLSYCWGPRKDLFYLKEEIIGDCEQAFPWEKIPKTIRDANFMTRMLGCRHIWVDSLCILKDSREDWLTESVTMSAINQNCICTIAAERARDAEHGVIVRQYPLVSLPCRLLKQDSRFVFAQPKAYAERKLFRYSNLSSRAWCFQERLLSTRILIVSRTGMHWICAQGEADEWNPNREGLIKGASTSSGGDSLPATDMSTRNQIISKIFGPSVTMADWTSKQGLPDAAKGKEEFLLIQESTLCDTIEN